MASVVQGVLSVAGRAALSTIFILAAVGNKIPHFSAVSEVMAAKGIPAPGFMLAGAIVFLIVGGLSVVVGYKARIGAFLLLVFLALASYYFHDFWRLNDPKEAQTIQFMKNLSMIGAMLFIIANGPGAWSLDARRATPRVAGETVAPA